MVCCADGRRARCCLERVTDLWVGGFSGVAVDLLDIKWPNPSANREHSLAAVDKTRVATEDLTACVHLILSAALLMAT